MNTFSFARKLLVGALCTAASALTASATTIYDVKLVNSGVSDIAPTVTIAGKTINNVYIGPYTISVDGYNLSAMCIDFNIASYVGDTYKAYATGVGSSNLSNTYAPADGQEYEEEAYLFSQITKTGVSDSTRTSIQEAAWDIMAYGITGSGYKTTLNSTSSSLKTNTNTTAVEGYIDLALANYSGYANLGYYIISDTTKNGEQEFLTYYPTSTSVTPEPSSLMLMLAPSLLAGAEAVRRRKLGGALLG